MIRKLASMVLRERDRAPQAILSEAESSISRGKALAIAGRIDEAVLTLESALVLARGRRDSFLEADALDFLSWLSWIELDGERTRSYAQRMLTLEVPATSPAAFRIFVRQATQSLQLGRPQAALSILEEAEHVSRDADIDSFIGYLSVRADVYAALGQPGIALTHAKLALDIAEKRSDPYQRWRRLEYYGYILYTNGRMHDSLATYRYAEEVARDASLTWEVPFSRIRAAWIAFLLGQMSEAHALIVSCFECRQPVRWMVVTRAWVGLLIGLAVNDDDLTRRCSDPAHVVTALDSGDSYSLGRTVAAFHEYYLHVGNEAEAQRLLELAVPQLTSPDCAWPLFAAIAAHGNASLVEYGQRLIATFPKEHALAQAFRFWVSAIAAKRAGDARPSERYAGEAQMLFEENEHFYYAARCLEHSGRLREAYCTYRHLGAVRDAQRTHLGRPRRGRPGRSYELGRQRREVRDLLFAGETANKIAARLGVSLRTVKNRVAEIYDFEGVANRAELLQHSDRPERTR